MSLAKNGRKVFKASTPFTLNFGGVAGAIKPLWERFRQ